MQTLQTWLKIEDCVHYDFVQDTLTKQLHTYTQLTPLEKYFLYRSNLYSAKYNDNLTPDAIQTIRDFLCYTSTFDPKDPDTSSTLLKDIYKHIWTEKYLEEYCPCSDTMTSSQILLNAAIHYLQTQPNTFHTITNTTTYIIPSTNSSIALAACNATTNLYSAIQNTFPELITFLSLYHTIGNYIPIPQGFNVPRSFYGKKDFFDITLMQIKTYYSLSLGQQTQYLTSNLLNNHPQADTKAVRHWLNKYGKNTEGWYHFINENYLQMYLDEAGEVIPFWQGHSEKNVTIPPDAKAYKAGLRTINQCIEKRGNKLIKYLKENC